MLLLLLLMMMMLMMMMMKCNNAEEKTCFSARILLVDITCSRYNRHAHKVSK